MGDKKHSLPLCAYVMGFGISGHIFNYACCQALVNNNLLTQ